MAVRSAGTLHRSRVLCHEDHKSDNHNSPGSGCATPHQGGCQSHPSAGALENERQDAAPIGLINGNKFSGFPIEYSIGVSKRSHDILEISSKVALTKGA